MSHDAPFKRKGVSCNTLATIKNRQTDSCKVCPPMVTCHKPHEEVSSHDAYFGFDKRDAAVWRDPPGSCAEAVRSAAVRDADNHGIPAMVWWRILPWLTAFSLFCWD